MIQPTIPIIGIGIAKSGFFGKLINAPMAKQIKRMEEREESIMCQ